MDSGHAFLLVETAATIFMAGVLWTMQVLNYPLLGLVGRDAFTGYETAHNRRFGLVVVPGVLAALAGAIGLLTTRLHQVPAWAPGGELALVIVIISSTVILQARQHDTLASGFDSGTLRSSVPTGSGSPRGRPPRYSACGCATAPSRHDPQIPPPILRGASNGQGTARLPPVPRARRPR